MCEFIGTDKRGNGAANAISQRLTVEGMSLESGILVQLGRR